MLWLRIPQGQGQCSWVFPTTPNRTQCNFQAAEEARLLAGRGRSCQFFFNSTVTLSSFSGTFQKGCLSPLCPWLTDPLPLMEDRDHLSFQKNTAALIRLPRLGRNGIFIFRSHCKATREEMQQTHQQTVSALGKLRL